jgi:ferredoxin
MYPKRTDSGESFEFGSAAERDNMAYVVTAPCFGCKYTDCVVVCPCECFHEGDQMLYINPDDCIDCDACRVECPVEAIFPEWDVPEEWQSFIQLNAEMARKMPSILEKKAPLADGKA